MRITCAPAHAREAHAAVRAEPTSSTPATAGASRRAGRPARRRHRASAAQAQRRAADGARGLHGASEAREPARAPRAARCDEGGVDWGTRRVARVRLAAAERRADPADGPGHRARHLLATATPSCTTCERARPYTPLQHLPGAAASFEIHNSPLSENACLAFEYGYSITEPDALVIWEAQFGDFANGAQVVIDQFIASAARSGAQTRGSRCCCPHGYEGNGPEHSSARLERFLQLSADDNMRSRTRRRPPSTSTSCADQALRPQRRPLVVMTPKGLLRSKDAASRASTTCSIRAASSP